MLKKIVDGILAGIMISIGGSVYLSCENKYVGAFFFSIALLMICIHGFSLYTGKVGFLPEKCGKEELSVLFLGLLGNTVAVILCGWALRYAIPTMGTAALKLYDAKLLQGLLPALIRSVFCGILMYFAVATFKKDKNIVGILFCIPVFILSGFEHSVADMFYFAASGEVSLKAFVYILIVIAGNSIGGMLVPLLSKIGKGKNKNVG